MNLLEPRGRGVGSENPDGTCLLDSKNGPCSYGLGYAVAVESPSTTELRITTEVSTELESAIKSLKLRDTEPHQDRDDTPDGGQPSSGEITLNSSSDIDSSCCERTPCNIPVTSPSKLEKSTVMEPKLIVPPPSAENSGDSITGPIRLEKWFVFGPMPEKNTETLEKMQHSL